tara:strand:- start:12936 stop:13244 length:309 start_codon:yes stop_codon:yes gene_type:complete
MFFDLSPVAPVSPLMVVRMHPLLIAGDFTAIPYEIRVEVDMMLASYRVPVPRVSIETSMLVQYWSIIGSMDLVMRSSTRSVTVMVMVVLFGKWFPKLCPCEC